MQGRTSNPSKPFFFFITEQENSISSQITLEFSEWLSTDPRFKKNKKGKEKTKKGRIAPKVIMGLSTS